MDSENMFNLFDIKADGGYDKEQVDMYIEMLQSAFNDQREKEKKRISELESKVESASSNLAEKENALFSLKNENLSLAPAAEDTADKNPPDAEERPSSADHINFDEESAKSRIEEQKKKVIAENAEKQRMSESVAQSGRIAENILADARTEAQGFIETAKLQAQKYRLEVDKIYEELVKERNNLVQLIVRIDDIAERIKPSGNKD